MLTLTQTATEAAAKNGSKTTAKPVTALHLPQSANEALKRAIEGGDKPAKFGFGRDRASFSVWLGDGMFHLEKGGEKNELVPVYSYREGFNNSEWLWVFAESSERGYYLLGFILYGEHDPITPELKQEEAALGRVVKDGDIRMCSSLALISNKEQFLRAIKDRKN